MSSGQIRDFVLLYVNGREHRVRGELAFMQLADYLRAERGLCGTKVVCAEGDCGACTVLVGRKVGDRLDYKPINSCIQAIYQLDCAHVVTVEGLNSKPNELNAIQQSMVDCHGAQCGYCTPGFIMSLAALFENGCGNTCAEQSQASGSVELSRQAVKGALTGNLCRCTGYESIIKSALECDVKSMMPLEQLYPTHQMLELFESYAVIDVRIETARSTVFIPHEIETAVQFKQAHEGTVIISGGTDVGVNMNKRGLRPAHILSICNLQGLDDLRIEDGLLTVGARVTLEQLAECLKDKIPEFYKVLWVFGAPQIRYAGTLAGNIANASPIGDSLPFLFVMEADVEVFGVHGHRRIPICSLYTGYKKLDMSRDEIITRILIPLPKTNETLRLFKVSKREHLDISSFAAAFLLTTTDGGAAQAARISRTRVAFGGVGPTVLRLPETELFLQGKAASFDSFEAAGAVAVGEITPIGDVRGSADFRKQLAENIFLKCWFSLEEPEALLV